MSYGLAGGLVSGFVAGSELRRKEEAFEEEKKTNKLRRDSLELTLQKQRGELADAQLLRDSNDYWVHENNRIKVLAYTEGGLNDYKPTPFEEFRASRKAKEQPKAEPAPERKMGIAGLVSDIRNAFSTPATGVAAPAAPADAAQQPAAGVQAPVAGAQAPASDGPVPEEAPSPRINPYIPPGARNPDDYAQRLRLQADLLREVYRIQGKHELAAKVDDDLKKQLNTNWELRLGTNSSRAANGSRLGMQELAKLKDLVPDGYSMDGGSGVFDSKSQTWKGVIFKNDETGETIKEDLGPEWFLSIAYKYDAATALKEINNLQDKRARLGIEQQKADADTVSAAARASTAATQAARLTADANQDLNAKRQRETVLVLGGMFPRANKEPAPMDVAMQKGEAAQKAYKKTFVDQTRQFELANTVLGLNTKIDARTAGTLARDLYRRPMPVGRNADGSYYVTYSGKKVVIPDYVGEKAMGAAGSQ